ncbi:MAG: hypothetical protein JW808_06130 [Victivallales bacterium]|nr:hypothetical protein [Victivallales bacterium]
MERSKVAYRRYVSWWFAGTPAVKQALTPEYFKSLELYLKWSIDCGDVFLNKNNLSLCSFNQTHRFCGGSPEENMFYHNAAKIMGFEQECGMEYIAGRDNFP